MDVFRGDYIAVLDYSLPYSTMASQVVQFIECVLAKPYIVGLLLISPFSAS